MLLLRRQSPLSSPISLEQPEQPPASGSCSLGATTSHGFDERDQELEFVQRIKYPNTPAVFGLHVSITLVPVGRGNWPGRAPRSPTSRHIFFHR
jgi:hypothetical protein